VNLENEGVIKTRREVDLGNDIEESVGGWTKGEGNVPDDDRFSASRWNGKISKELSWTGLCQ